MNNNYKLVLSFLIGCTVHINAQNLIIKKDNTLLQIESKESQLNKVSKKNIEIDQGFVPLDKIDYWGEQIGFTKKKKDEETIFFSGLQNPFDKDNWVYVERPRFGSGFTLKQKNIKTSKVITLFTSKTKGFIGNDGFSNGILKESKLAFVPIGWTNDKNKIYVEFRFFNSAFEHEGIGVFDLITHKVDKIKLPFNYHNTPILSPDRSKFYFTASLDKKINRVHGASDWLLEFNVIDSSIHTIVKEKGSILQILGWDNQLNQKERTLYSGKMPTTVYHLPWQDGFENVVSRHGIPAPPPGHNPSRPWTGAPFTGVHGQLATDYATNPSVDEIVAASGRGRVVYAQVDGSLTSGFGRLVIIEHPDGEETYYAHNKRFLVSVGQQVESGQPIAIEGTSGGSTGDHIHFELRTNGGGFRLQRTFEDAGHPRQNFWYIANRAGANTSDTESPVSTMTATGGTTQSDDFTVNFNDQDNVGVTGRYYQVLEKYGDTYLANRGNGFFNDNYGSFYTGYQRINGNWSISNNHLLQANTSSDNTNLSSFLSQTSLRPYVYEFDAKIVSTSGPRKFGLHIMTSDATQSQRGNSYLIWFSGEDNKVRIYETINNQLNFRAIGDVPLNNLYANYKIEYNPENGRINVFRNNKQVLTWTDSTPIRTGRGISFRTNSTMMEFDDLKVYKQHAASALVTTGTLNSNDARTRNVKIKSLARDAAGNWSSRGNLDVIVTSLSRQLLSDPSLDVSALKEFILYPNPTKGGSFSMHYTGTIDDDLYISLIDITGKIVAKDSIKVSSESAGMIDLQNYIQGIHTGQYFIIIVSDKETYTLPFVKK